MLKGRVAVHHMRWTYMQDRMDKIMKIKFPKNSISLFNYASLVTYALSMPVRYIVQQYILYFVFILVFIQFMVYSIVRFNHYKTFFPLKQSIMYSSIDNGILLLGIIYLFSAQRIIFKGSNEVNLPFSFSLIIFIVPSIVGNVRLTQKGKQSL